jgi:hypothetical protein
MQKHTFREKEDSGDFVEKVTAAGFDEVGLI